MSSINAKNMLTKPNKYLNRKMLDIFTAQVSKISSSKKSTTVYGSNGFYLICRTKMQSTFSRGPNHIWMKAAWLYWKKIIRRLDFSSIKKITVSLGRQICTKNFLSKQVSKSCMNRHKQTGQKIFLRSESTFFNEFNIIFLAYFCSFKNFLYKFCHKFIYIDF